MGVGHRLQHNGPAGALIPDVELSPLSAVGDSSTPGSIGFTPINSQWRETSSQSNVQEVPSGVTCRDLKDSASFGRKRTAEHTGAILEKKHKTTIENNGRADAKLLATVQTPAQTPLPPFKLTKPMGRFHGQAPTEKDDDYSFIVSHDLEDRGCAHVGGIAAPIERVVPLSPGSYSPTFKDTGSYNHTGLIKGDSFNRSLWYIDGYYARGMDYEANIMNGNTLTPGPTAFTEPGTLDNNDGTMPLGIASEYHAADAYDWQSDLSDAYPLDDDIARILADPSGWVQENHIPPSSVQGWDHDSRSAMEFDPSLKRSPPDAREPNTNTAGSGDIFTTQQPDASEDLLDEDVDWNAVLANANRIQKNSSIGSYSHAGAPEHANGGLCEKHSDRVYSQVNQVGSSPAFVRPPFPGKIRDRPSVPGMSSDTLLRTCFRIGAMISQTVCCANHQQDVVFELYARVTYSSRETLARKQHFQFVDLSKDQQPYPAAKLINWRAGSQLDIDGAAFLDTSGGPRLCWCMCKPVRDPKAAVGWTYTILRIRETDWEQIYWAMKVICGDP